MGNHTAAYENKGPDVIQINWHCRNHANYLSNLATRGAVGSTPPVYIRERKLQNHSGKKLRLERSYKSGIYYGAVIHGALHLYLFLSLHYCLLLLGKGRKTFPIVVPFVRQICGCFIVLIYRSTSNVVNRVYLHPLQMMLLHDELSVVRSSGPNVPVTVAECNGVVVPNQLSLSTSTSVDSGIWRASSVASH
ncbi:hypothetical protein T4E_3221 [Trichinella pseudospiralis]|uniref:Uncharacterized protein n=1 Tax=Trichinella pseudospiralis TaxID=6337 RepID=A0A0V0XN50_TRIPS|nr:hypothetical protein T4E_3221 [Trichinella pseudospiralis]